MNQLAWVPNAASPVPEIAIPPGRAIVEHATPCFECTVWSTINAPAINYLLFISPVGSFERTWIPWTMASTVDLVGKRKPPNPAPTSWNRCPKTLAVPDVLVVHLWRSGQIMLLRLEQLCGKGINRSLNFRDRGHQRLDGVLVVALH